MTKKIILALLNTMLLCTGCAQSETASASVEETGSVSTPESTQAAEEETKILVAYFSATGNTKGIAEEIADITGGDLFEIIPAEPYTEEDLNYNNDNCRANLEQNDETSRPAIANVVENMDAYDIVLIGHPIWWGEEPRIIDTFVESYDLSSKTVVNFCTSGGSGISTAIENLKALTPEADWLEGNRFASNADTETIQAWLEEINITGE